MFNIRIFGRNINRYSLRRKVREPWLMLKSRFSKRLARATARLLQDLAPWESPSIEMIRIGREGDGGYVVGDIFTPAQVDACYSLGVGDDVSCDRDIAERGIPVFLYDHTVDALPEDHEQFHFHRIGVCGKPHLPAEQYVTKLCSPAGAADEKNPPELREPGVLIKANGHQGKKLVLNMDIEGHEYGVFEALTDEELAGFSQIACEFHFLDRLLCDETFHEIVQHCWRRILRTMHVVHIHANNAGYVAESHGVKIPDLLELTFLNKALVDDFRPARRLRTDLDRKNKAHKPEIDISDLWMQDTG